LCIDRCNENKHFVVASIFIGQQYNAGNKNNNHALAGARVFMRITVKISVYRTLRWLVSIVFCILLLAEYSYATPPENLPKVIPSSYIVVFHDNVDTDKTASELARRFTNMSVSFRYRHALRGMAVKMPLAVLEKLKADPRIDYIEPDVTVSLTSQILPTGVDRINADDDTTANIDGVDDRVNADIAILDTGIDLDHPDLYVYRYAYCSTSGFPRYTTSCVEGDSNADDVHSHGTHVAGIAAALDNTSGVVGVAPGARLWAVKVLDDSGNGEGSILIAGVDYVAEHANEIEVANMSLTGDGSFKALDDALDGAISAGVVFTLAAGNDSKDVAEAFPAGHPNAITVSALADYDGIAGGLSGDAEDDTFATFSNYGSGVDIMAPGRNIRSTGPGGGLRTKSGTSMSSPHVAGAAALYMSQNPSANPASVKEALLTTVDPTPCVNNVNGICGAPQDPDGIQEPLILLSCYDEDSDSVCGDVDNCPLDSNPLQTDTDLDTAGDACDDDDDNDGLPDVDEITIGTDILLVDTDGDRLTDGDEVLVYGTNPTLRDSDGDGFGDDVEIGVGTNANNPAGPWPLADGDLAPVGVYDGLVNVADYLVAQRMALGLIPQTELDIAHGDLQPIGTSAEVIDTADVLLILQQVLNGP
jgi:subtilisin